MMKQEMKQGNRTIWSIIYREENTKKGREKESEKEG